MAQSLSLDSYGLTRSKARDLNEARHDLRVPLLRSHQGYLQNHSIPVTFPRLDNATRMNEVK